MSESIDLEIEFSEEGLANRGYAPDPDGVDETVMKALDGKDDIQGVTYIAGRKTLPALFKSMPFNQTLGGALYQVGMQETETDVQGGRLGAGPKSVRDVRTGIVHHPFDMDLAIQMRTVSPYHATCIDKLSEVFVGKGFKDKRASRMINDLTQHGTTHWLMEFAKTEVATGQAYTELVRGSSGYVDWMQNVSPAKMALVLPTFRRDIQFYVHQPNTHYKGYGLNRRCDRPSDADLAEQVGFFHVGQGPFLRDIVRRAHEGALSFLPEKMGEVAAFHTPTEQWDHYGCPQWIGAHAYLELNRIHLQRAHDYCFNRGTPDTVTFIYGMSLSKPELEKFKKSMQAGLGPGHGRSTVMFIPNSSAKTGKVQVEKFGDSVDGASFQQLHDTYALGACAAHGVLPVLAGISVAKSLGSANEILQALVLLQMTRIQKMQTMFQDFMFKNVQPYLRGAPKLNYDFFEIEPLVNVEDSDFAAMNSVARQRESSLGPSTSDNGLKRD